ncbi:MAG TPA: BON domain-containing protein [Candidatus Polarisedimenticolia bacterium]|nr:BON domain-containing protein [Candidatus Polarisedimenticolia bacterium]
MKARRWWWSSAAMAALALAAIAAQEAGAAGCAGDAELERQILRRLLGQVEVREEGITVEVECGVAVLRGAVASIGEAERLERLASGIVGIRSVANRVAVAPTTRSDLAVAQEVRRRLERYPRLRRPTLMVSASDGVVTLSGEVERDLDGRQAESIAADVAGVRRVVNTVRVTGEERPDDALVQSRVMSLLANPLTFGAVRDLRVRVEDGIVVLEGTVAREADRHEAERLAGGVPGVAGVRNDLVVENR